jgi:hypothetical protein
MKNYFDEYFDEYSDEYINALISYIRGVLNFNTLLFKCLSLSLGIEMHYNI